MIPQAFHNKSEKKKINFKERPEVAQIRHVEENMHNRNGEETTRKEIRN